MDKEPHAYRHAPSEDNHEPEPGCPCYYCHRLPAEHDDYEPVTTNKEPEPMSTDDKYNGWTNWETWNTNLWITNDEGLYAVAKTFVAEETYVSDDDIEAHGDDAKPSLNVYEAAQAIREWWDAWAGPADRGTALADAWGAMLDAVNWEEIAEGLAEE